MDNIHKSPARNVIEMIDKVFESVGLSQKNSHEFTSENILNFNTIAEDSPYVDYYSVGAQKQLFQVGDMLRAGHEMISEK